MSVEYDSEASLEGGTTLAVVVEVASWSVGGSSVAAMP